MWPWLLLALGAHTGWGIYPVLGRYLQTVSGLPSLSLLVVGYAPLAILFLVYTLPRHGRAIARSRALWVFALIVVARSITNILAARYTAALYVQLITLMTPFIVAFLS
ncbi:MAG: EamA family transporter, partial [Caldilineaceae bacterium]